MNTNNQQEGAASGSDTDRSKAESGQLTLAAAPTSNHGAKEQEKNPAKCPETVGYLQGGEKVELIAGPKHNWVVIHPLPNEATSPHAAIVDWLAFTIIPPLQISLLARANGCEDIGYQWMCGELSKYFNVEASTIERQKTGGSGYKYRAQFPGGQILWGGKNQRGTVNVSISGVGCSRIDDWPAVASWLENHQAKLKRVDLAYDDFACETVSIEQLRAWYESGKFGAGGRQPEAQLVDDLGSGKGRTFYIGNRKNGKLCRGYEKGKQLGDPESRWVRVEVEWHDKSRMLPYDMLTRPGQYLAGAYPCLGFLNIEQSKIKTIYRGAKIVFDRAVGNARQQVGKLVNLCLMVFGGDSAEVVERLIRRDGYPKKIEPYSYHISRGPEAINMLSGIAPYYA